MTDNNEDDYEPEDTAAHSTDEDEELAEAYGDCDDDFVPFNEVEERTCEFENHARGVVVEGEPDDNPVMRRLMADVNGHGEVHATVEEHDTELEIRRGTAIMDFRDEVILLDTDADFNNLVVAMNRIVDWYRPMSAWH